MFLSITTCSDNDFFSDYLRNPEKRMSHVTMFENFWLRYKVVYEKYRNDGSLIWRSKHVEDGVIHISQVWIDEIKRRQFQHDAGIEEYEKSNRKVDFTYSEKECDMTDVDKLIDHVMSQDDYIIQWCKPNLRRSGMVIGDPLKNDGLILVE